MQIYPIHHRGFDTARTPSFSMKREDESERARERSKEREKQLEESYKQIRELKQNLYLKNLKKDIDGLKLDYERLSNRLAALEVVTGITLDTVTSTPEMRKSLDKRFNDYFQNKILDNDTEQKASELDTIV